MIYLNDIGIVNALGYGKQTVYDSLLQGISPGMGEYISPIYNRPFMAGQVLHDLPQIPQEFSQFDCRNNQLIMATLEQIEAPIKTAIESYGADRVGVVVGTSTSGIDEAEQALLFAVNSENLPEDFDYKKQEIGAASEFIAGFLKLRGPAYTISTACSSSGKVFASARELINMGLCDCVILGGADSLCELTLSGFASLEATSSELTNPFSVNRKGINIGEGAAFFIMSREQGEVRLMGVGESSDAYHMSAPEPQGKGAESAMRAALEDAMLKPCDVDYINLHGTGTKLNDAMESHAVFSIFSDKTAASSTKAYTGHTLGAAGATEAAICWLLLKNAKMRKLAVHRFDGQLDPLLSPINIVQQEDVESEVRVTMSNSFAFGGNNVSVILGGVD